MMTAGERKRHRVRGEWASRMHGSSGAGRASSTLRFLPRRPGTCAFWRRPGTLICAPIQQLTALSWGAAGAGGAGRCVQVHTDRGCAALQPQFTGWQRQHRRARSARRRTCTQRSRRTPTVHSRRTRSVAGVLDLLPGRGVAGVLDLLPGRGLPRRHPM